MTGSNHGDVAEKNKCDHGCYRMMCFSRKDKEVLLAKALVKSDSSGYKYSVRMDQGFWGGKRDEKIFYKKVKEQMCVYLDNIDIGTKRC